MTSACIENGKTYFLSHTIQEGIRNQSGYSLKKVVLYTQSALVVIGCLGTVLVSALAVGGVITTAPLTGKLIIGLSTTILLSRLTQGDLKKPKLDFLLGALLVAAPLAIAILGAVSFLNASQVGWGVLGVYSGLTAVIWIKGINQHCKSRYWGQGEKRECY